jgi:heat shock protein HslJ
MPSFRLPGLLFAAALALAACSGGVGAASSAASGDAPAAVPATPEALDGRTFVATGMTGGSLVEGSTVTLTFDGNTIGVSVGCNQGNGAYGIVDGIVKLGPMATTEMACDPALMAQDAAMTTFLDGATATVAGDTLTFTKGDVTLTLLDKEVATPDGTLEGPRWVVDAVQTGSTVSSVPAGATAAMTFGARTIAVEAGCNTGSGPYTVEGDAITFGPIALTMMACPADKMALEAAVLSVLQGEATYEIDANTLRLVNGSNGLHLTAAP